jgi:hypothetical protein
MKEDGAPQTFNKSVSKTGGAAYKKEEEYL